MWEESVFKVARFEVHKAVSVTIGVLCSALLGNWFLTLCWIVANSPVRDYHGLILILKKEIRNHLPSDTTPHPRNRISLVFFNFFVVQMGE